MRQEGIVEWLGSGTKIRRGGAKEGRTRGTGQKKGNKGGNALFLHRLTTKTNNAALGRKRAGKELTQASPLKVGGTEGHIPLCSPRVRPGSPDCKLTWQITRKEKERRKAASGDVPLNVAKTLWVWDSWIGHSWKKKNPSYWGVRGMCLQILGKQAGPLHRSKIPEGKMVQVQREK